LAFTVATVHADTFGSGNNAFTFDFVTIGNAGNANDRALDDTDDTPGDPAVRGDHEGAGKSGDGDEPVELSRYAVARIVQAWIAEPVLAHVASAAGRVVRDINTDKADTRSGELAGGGGQGWCFLLADCAPRSPEIQHYDVATVGRQTELPTGQSGARHYGKRWALPQGEHRGPDGGR
jgi:hypothetical protein